MIKSNNSVCLLRRATYLFILFSVFACSQAEAVQIKKVHRGVANLDAGDSLASVAIGTTVEPTKTLVLVTAAPTNTTANNTGERNFFVVAQLSGNDSIQIERGGGDVAISVAWQAIEFSEGVRVQTGISSLAKGELSKAITLPALSPALDVTKAVPIIMTRNINATGNAATSYQRTNEFFLKPTLTAGPTLTLERLKASIASRDKAVPVVWQVAEFSTDATVYSGTVCFPVPGAAGAQTATNDGLDSDGGTTNCGTNSSAFSPALSNSGANALLFYYPLYGSGHAGQEIIMTTRGTISSGTAVTFTRGRSSTTALTHVEVRYYVVDFTDGTTTLGAGLKASLQSTGDPALKVVSSSTDAVSPTTTRITTSAVHGITAPEVMLLGGHTTNTAANGMWNVTSVPSTTTLDIADFYGAIVEGTGAGAGSGGNLNLMREVNLTTGYGGGAVGGNRVISLVYPSATNVADTTVTYMDDLQYIGHVYQKSGTWYLGMSRNPTGRAIAADYDYLTYEFPSVTLKTPNGGNNLVVGDFVTVTWAASDDVATNDWKLQISTDAPHATWTDLTTANSLGTCGAGGNSDCTGTSLSTGTVQWKVPDQIGTTVKLRIYDTTDAQTTVARKSDMSNTDFTVRGRLTIVLPNGEEVWSIGVGSAITWTKTGSLDYSKVTLKLSQDGGSTYPATITNNLTPSSLSYTWTPTASEDGTTNRVKAELDSDPTYVYDTSDADFIVRGSITVTAPNGTEEWATQTDQNITWTRTGVFSNVKIEYSTNSGGTFPTTIVASTPAAAGTYTWTNIPVSAVSTFGRIRITNTADSNVTDMSNNDFSVVASITVTSPNSGAEVWSVGTAYPITWAINGTMSTVKIEYSTDSGATWVNPPIATGITAANGTYNWTIPDAIGDLVRVKVSDESAPSTRFDASNNDFKIRGAVSVSAPASGNVWKVGSTQLIQWTKAGSFGNSDILYSTNGGSSFPNTLATNQAGTAWSWVNIPDVIGNNVVVRVRATDYSSDTFGDSAAFSIKGSLTVVAPNGGQQWGAGTEQSITWTKTGTIGNIELRYSEDGGSNFTNVIASPVDVTTGTPYAWMTPTITGTQFRVRAALLSDATVYDDSNANFSLRGSVTLTRPNTNLTFIAETSENITWTYVGTMANVKLELSKDSGSNYLAGDLIVASTPCANQSYTWTVADAIGTTNRIQISDAGDASVNDQSNADFTVKGALTVTAPNGGQSWVVGATQNITWTKKGTVPNVKLEYSTDGGSTFPNSITASTPGANLSFPWTIPNAIGTDLKVKITNLSDASVTDESDNTFGIKGSVTIAAPNGNEAWGIGTNKSITWTRTGTLSGNVKLEYSTDAGSTYPIGNLISNTADVVTGTPYTWAVPDAPTTQGRIKITYLGDTTVNDQSDNNFSIKGSVTMVTPNTNVTWSVGESRNIVWSRGGSIANVKLNLSTDGGATYPTEIVATTPAADLSYAWTVTDVVGTQLRIKVTDASDNTVTDESDVNFTVKPTLTVAAPNGGQSWIVGASQNITWTKTGTVSNVRLEYSTNAFADENAVTTIVNSVAGSDLSYPWTIPNSIGTNLKVRIVNLADTSVTDVSNGTFTIKGSLTMSSPNAGTEVWIVGENRDLVWTLTGTIDNVKLEYSTNGFSDETQTFTIINSTPAETNPPVGVGNGKYTWQVADAMGSSVKVRVTNVDDTSVKDVSDNAFTIKGSIALTAPSNSNITWTVGTNQTISWTRTGSFANVELRLSTDGGSTFPTQIVASTPADPLPTDNAGSYVWSAGDFISTTAKIRAINASDSSVSDDSDNNFRIRGSITVTAPNAGTEKWEYNTPHNITWTKAGSIASVKLEYSTNGFSDETQTVSIATGVNGSSGTPYAWTIPDAVSQTVKVRVTDENDSAVTDVSDNAFKIVAGFHVDSPIGGEVWTVNSPQTILWTTYGSTANVKIEYSTDGGLSYPNEITASTSNTGSFSWTVPNAITTSAKVRVSQANETSAFDVSDSNFKIRGSLAVNSPNGGEALSIGNSQNIQWTRVGSIANVKLEYSTNAFSNESQTTVILATTPADPDPADNVGIYSWSIPDAVSPNVKVRVSDASDATVTDVSNSVFSIKGQVVLNIPNGGQTWVVGTTQNVQWTKYGGIANVKLEYSKDGGTTWPGGNLIVSSTAADPPPSDDIGTYSWTIADAIGTQLRVRVSDAADPSTLDSSDADFAVKGQITLTAPNGGDTWIVGSTENITWDHQGSFANVKLEYSTNGFSDESQTTLITSGTANDGSFGWTIPDAIGSSLKVRASDAADASVIDASNNTFTVKGSVTVTSPNGTEVWKVGESRNITWTKTGTMTNVKIESSTNAGGSFPNVIIASTPATAGTYAWTVPDSISTQARIKITSTADSSVNDTSNANFEIRGVVTLTSPNGTEVWTVDDPHDITWTKAGTFSNVKLEYSTNAFSDELQTSTIQTGVDAVTGTPFNWSVPDAISSTVRVRVTNEADSNVVDVSNGNFKIVGSLTLTSPNTNVSWSVGSTRTISWDRVGSIANAKLEYSINGGSSYPVVIVASTGAAAGAYIWTIPDAIGSSVRVKISDAADSSVNDTSDTNFSIMAGFAVTAPNGGEVWTVASGQTITWTTAGTVSNVKLEYSTNAFSNETQTTVVAANTANTGTYSWTVPDAISNLVRVRVSDVNNSNAFDISNASAKIRGALLVNAPNGAEAWLIGASQNIQWTRTGSIANVKLEYSTNAFVDETQTAVIVASTAADPAPSDNIGIYAWTIPDTPGTVNKVRVTDASDATVLDTSNANFSIKGQVIMQVPNGTEVWKVDAVQNIQWSKFGAISNVKLTYSTDSGGTWPVGNLIVASTAADPAPIDNTGFYSWTIPDVISGTLRVRVQDAADSSTYDDSNADFRIQGSVTMTAPNGGEIWTVGTNQNITWGHTGTFSNVKLEYSTNGFTNETQTFSITTATPNDGSFTWPIPDAIGTALKVRASDATDATVVDTSDANFTVKGSLALTSPNGSDVWKVGESRNVTWNRVGSIANVKLEYSTNGGSTYPNTISASTGASSGTYSWTIPDAIGSQLRVRVSDVSDSSVNDTSDANFQIKGTVIVTAPNGGEVWTVNTPQNITWTKTGTFSTVKLEYSTNAFSDELQTTEIATAIDSTLGTYAWTIPDTIGSALRVRISNEADATVVDTSNLSFKVVGSLTLVAPNGGQNWAVGSSKTVTWSRVGSIANAKLELSTDGGSSYGTVIVASTGAAAQAYIWTIPDAIGANRRVKISDAADSTVSDTSDANFTIMAGFLVTDPDGGEVWTVGSAQAVTWDTTGTVSNVKLEYSTNAFSDELQNGTIAANTPNTGTFSWTVADAISNLNKVRVSDVNNANAFDISNAVFKIRGSLAVNAPNGGEAWLIGNAQNIQWTRTGSVANVKVEYSTNAFADETQTAVIIASTPADPAPSDNVGIYAWTLPDNPSTTSKVRVTDASDATVYDTSNANFSIKGQVIMQVPNGGEVWTVAGVQNVQWTKFGAISNVQLQYSTDSGSTWPAPNIIVASTAADPAPVDNAGFYSWTIPDAIGTQVRVRVQDAADSSTYDDSNADFKIRGSVTITAPNGSEVLIVGANQNITWTKTGSFSNVKLEYSTNAFANETQTTSITAATPNNGTFAWSVPDAIGSTVKVRASDAADSTVNDVSNGNFTIKGSLTLTSPDGTETWKVGESKNITWNRVGSIANVKLEYSVNGGSNFTSTIIASTTASTGTYAWTVPDAIGTQLRVRVSDVTDSTVNDASNANFTIKGTVTLTAPNGGEVWAVGVPQNITWTKTGTYSTVKLEYSTNAFSDELQVTEIATAVDATLGTYSWMIPDTIGSSLKVRISNESDTSVVDTSNLSFKVVGSLTLIAPNGGQNWAVASSKTITWTRVGSIANAKLELSTDGGSTYGTVIVASTGAAAQAYIWTIPDSIGSNRKVKISDASDSTVLDVSDANFTIMGGFTITDPDGGEVWTVGSAQSITWNTTGTVSNVKLEYSTNAFSNETQTTTIASNTPNTGTFSWTVADAISNLNKVRVSDVTNANAFDISDAVFKVRGALVVTAPNSGEAWLIGTNQNIQWSLTGSIANVKVEYSTNAFADETQTAVIIASTPADPAPVDNSGQYSWAIPDNPSVTVKVRVTDASDSTVLDTSNANFSIKGRVIMGVPNGSEVWTVAGVQNIQWTKFGAISNVQLQYSTDSGNTWPAPNIIVASTAADPAPVDNAGFYSWTIPDAIGTLVRVRVQDASDSSTYDDSDADFKIRGSITITAPNGGEVWIVGTNQNITWSKAGTYPNVKLEYSTNAYSDETQTTVITAATPNNGTYSWSIPDAISSTLRVRASDAADSTVVDTSNGNFTIKGSLTLTAPNGSEVWKVGENRSITWNRAGSIANVKLEYSNNGGSTYANSIIASTDANTGTYTWAVPDAIGSQLRVRVSNVIDASVNDTSDANFQIKGTVTVVAPNGSEQWAVNTPQSIVWTKTGSFTAVKLEYSTNAFSDELQTTVIATGVDAATGTPYTWTVPDVIGSAVRVRVTNEADVTVLDRSDNNFKIVGSLTVVAPNGTENWNVGTSQTVSWTRVGSIANVKIEYSPNGGSSYPNLVTASTGAGAGAYAWTIPDSIGTNRRVKITDASDSSVFDTSNANFSIVATFNVTAPNGGEVWTVGATQNITWGTTGSVASVALAYSTDGGANYSTTITASTPNNATYSWVVPDSISTLVKVRVSDANDPNGFDTSNAVFKIRGAIAVNAPNGGEQWGIATTQNVQWTRTGSITNVKLEYSSNAFSDETQTGTIIASTPADPAPSDNIGIYGWLIPDSPGIVNKVRVTDVSDSTVFDTSNSNFSIKGSLTITAPNGSENWIVGTPYNITWVKGGAISNVKLQYSTDGGNTWPDPAKVITGSTSAGFQSFTWTIPDDITSQGRIRILDTIDNSVNDTSNANFAIKGSVTVTSPNGTEIWTVGETQNITWTKTGSIGNVALDYSTDGGSTYPGTIAASVSAAALTYAWVIPDSISNQVRVKITQTNDAVVTDSSDADLKIRGSLTVTSPNGGEVWKVANAQPITWTKTGSLSTIKIDYSTNGGATFPNSIATGVDASAGSYSWTIPNAITTNARIKLTSEQDATVNDASNADFKIAGSITVVAPNGGEKWLIAGTQSITWTLTGSISAVKIEYSTDGGSTYPNMIAASVNASTGTPYSWLIPDTPTTQGRVKITNTADTTVFDASNGNFKIQGSVAVVAPNGGESWGVGEAKSITWTKGGSFANVKIDYSTDSGATFPNIIIASTPSDNLSYAWTVPDNISTTSRVRITDVNDIEVTDSSNANFTIRGSFVVAAPNGGEIWRVGQAQNVTWTVSGSVGNAKIEYSTNAFADESQTQTIVATTPAGNLSYAWNIPDSISNTVKVRISDVDGISLADVSNGSFSIKGLVTLTAPNGGESFGVASATNITWNRTGSFANVKLEYSTNAFADESQSNLITASTPADPAPVDNTGTFAWSVPDAISTTVKIRITDALDAATTDVSNNGFTIRGILTITSPNGAEKWIVGTGQLITWDRFGSISNVKLQYTTNGTIYTDIILSTPNTGSYAWTIPNSITTTGKVRIYDANNATVTDDSNANFKIQAGFTLSSPNGGEAWLVGSTQSISWSTFGTVAFIRLDYSTDSGATYANQITTSTGNTGSYSWIMPDNPSGTVRVRVADTNDIEAFDASNADFRIRVAYSLVTPNGAEQWRVGRSQNITWGAVGTSPNVKLVYSRDGFFGDNQNITLSTPNTGSYAWTLPDSISNTVRVKISDPNDIGAFDTSNADFRITGDFAITSPNGGEKWDVESDHSITWTHAGTVPNAKLEYSTNAGGSWSPIVGLTANNGTFLWAIPDSITANGRIQISDPNDSTAADISDANFKIKGAFTLATPNGSEVWTVGESRNITWSNTGTIANVKMWYSTDGGTTFPNVIVNSVANTGTYSWTIPDSISTQVRVRVGSTSDVDAYDDSDANLKIRGKFVVSAPNGTEAWKIAQNFNIQWVTTGTIANVKIYYSTDSGATYPNVIVASTANGANGATASYTWNVPDVPSITARIRVENVSDSTVFDDSNADFKIQGNFTLTSPVGGEAWIVNSVHNISWSWGGTIPNVKLSYSTDGGSTYANVISASTPNGAGSSGTFNYSWTVPDNISSQVRVKVEDPNDTTVFSASGANFKIIGSLVLTSPNGGERWITYEPKTITWTSNGTIPNVKLTYSHNDFTTSTTIIASTPNTNTYNWTVPDVGIANIPKTTKVRVEDAADSTVNDQSNAAFNIDYYLITWDIRDLLTNAALSGLTVKQTRNTDETFIQWQETGISTNPARVQPTPYGTWGTVFTKTGYGDLIVVLTADRDQSFSLFMETTVIHLWLADSRTSFNPTTKSLTVNTWLSRDGSLLVGGALSCTYKIYNGSTLVGSFNLPKVIDSGGVDTGYFSQVLDGGPSGLNLQSGIVYTTITEMPIASGGVFKTPSSFEVTTPQLLQDMKATVDATLDKPLSQVESGIRSDMTNQLTDQKNLITTKLDAQTNLVTTKLDDQKATIVSKLDAQTNTIKVAIEDFTDKSDAAIAEFQDSTVKAAIRLILPESTKIGSDVTVRVSTEHGVNPTFDMLCPDGSAIMNASSMTETSTEGLYSTTVTFDSRFKCAIAKAITVVATAEVPSRGAGPAVIATAVGSLALTSTDLDTIQGLAAAGLNAERAAKDAKDAVMKMEKALSGNGNVFEAISNLQTTVNRLPSLMGQSQSSMGEMRDTVEQVANKLNTFIGKEGVDMRSILKEEIGDGMKGVRAKVDRTLAASKVMQQIMENKVGHADEPVIQSFFEAV
jgi:hypothetical protein